MGVQEFNPESPFGLDLKQKIQQRLATLNVEDPAYISDYLLLMIKNGQDPSYIVGEFTSLVGPIIDQQFVQEVINEILRNQGELNPIMQSQQELTFNIPEPNNDSNNNNNKPEFSFNIPTHPKGNANNMMIDGSDNKEVRFSEQNPFSNSNNNNISAFGNIHQENNNDNRFNFTKNNRNGNNFKTSRGGRGGARIMNSRRQDNMSKMIEMSLGNNNGMTTNIVSDTPKERCKDFPHCSTKFCPNAHPTRYCREFPNCPRQNQTCTYLHPGEDDALFQEYERVRDAKIEASKNNRLGNSGIVLCKFGSICQKESCPFAHPTPANKDAKVTLLQWCVDNKECKNPNCTRAHSSPNYKPFTQIASSESSFGKSTVAIDAGEKTLEQCKFGIHCKNARCPKRHATSGVLCRDGANCTRIDCSFNHPKNETCKFGVNCTNPKCAFQHPEGRQVSPYGNTAVGNKVWVNGQNQNTGSTSQRQFAVSEDQVLEQAPPQEA